MKQKKSRISVKISLYIAVTQIIAMLCLFLFISFSVSRNMRQTAIDTMQTISADRARLIEDYIRSSEEFLTAYTRAGEIADLLSDPADEKAVAAAQKFTETFSADKEFLEGIYVSEWNTHVLAHTNPSVPGMVTRKDEALNPFRIPCSVRTVFIMPVLSFRLPAKSRLSQYTGHAMTRMASPPVLWAAPSLQAGCSGN